MTTDTCVLDDGSLASAFAVGVFGASVVWSLVIAVLVLLMRRKK